METNHSKVVTLAQLISAHQKSSEKIEALAQRVAESSPTSLSDLDNDCGYQTGTQVAAAIQNAIARTGCAHFEVAEEIPAVEAAADNVLYLVMNSATNHYDIYAKVISDPDYGNFMATYGITLEEGTESTRVAFNLSGSTTSIGVSAGQSVQDVANSLNGTSRFTNDDLTASFDRRTGLIVVTDKTGATVNYTVGLGQTFEDDAALTPKTFTAEVVLLDDTAVDLSGYQAKEEGKGLSTNDYTNEDKAKLDGIAFATDAEVAAALAEIYGADET